MAKTTWKNQNIDWKHRSQGPKHTRCITARINSRKIKHRKPLAEEPIGEPLTVKLADFLKKRD